jgi:hypothetical protein
MAQSPKSGDARWGVVQPPNETGPGGNRAHNGYLPLVGSAGPLPPGGPGGGDRRNGCVPLAGIASPVHLPVDRFDVETAKMPQPPSAIEPGKGAIPVNPWNAMGRPNQAVPNSVIPREPGR